MKLSIITVNLNNLDGLRKTMDSVKMQQFIDFEFLVVDGNSIDGSVDLICNSANLPHGITKASNVKWFTSTSTIQGAFVSEADTGVFQAMNKGIRMAKGEYLLFLNSGDFFVDENVLSDVFSIDYSADLLCASCKITKQGKLVYVTAPQDTYTFISLYKQGINHQSTFIKRELFDKLGMYREDFKYNSDWEFFIRAIILNNCSTKKVDRIVCDYNLDGVSTTQSTTPLFCQEIEIVFSNPLLKKFIPDYELWFKERDEMVPLKWIESQTYLYKPLYMYYKLACYLVKIKNRIIT